MSRLGKKGIEIPAKTTVAVNGDVVSVKGPLGELSRTFKKNIAITVEGNKVELKPVKETLENKALWGTYASHIINMIEGVNKGYTNRLLVEGIGYKADVTPTNKANTIAIAFIFFDLIFIVLFFKRLILF